MLVCLVMALISALAYVLMGIGVMSPEDLESGDPTPAFFYIIPTFYVIYGITVLLKKRWLWITVALLNAFTIIMFYVMYVGRTDIMLSAAGLITKIDQILMEMGLIYLIVTHKRKESE